MQLVTQPGYVYRLIVALEDYAVEAVGCRFTCFEQAQARVAETVCRYGRTERVRAVVLQRGRPNARARRGRNGSPTRTTLADSDYDWTIEKHWGDSVIRRILLQHGIEPPAAPVPPQADAEAVPSPTLKPASPRPSSRPRPRGRHKSTRWHVTATIVVVILATIALILFQTGGHPTRFLSAFMNDQPTVKSELPFDARTSFAPPPQTETSAPTSTAADNTAEPD